MGYDLRIAEPQDRPDAAGLHLSVWQMSVVRDRMLECGAAYDANPTDMARTRARADRRRPGIPAYKISMIDGWLVTAREVSEALAIIRSRLDGLDDPTWKQWVDFLTDALGAGGFWVE
jgi:hypothetical protein